MASLAPTTAACSPQVIQTILSYCDHPKTDKNKVQEMLCDQFGIALVFDDRIKSEITTSLSEKSYVIFTGKSLSVSRFFMESFDELRKAYRVFDSKKIWKDQGSIVNFAKARDLEEGSFWMTAEEGINPVIDKRNTSFKNKALYHNLFLRQLITELTCLLSREKNRFITVILTRHDRDSFDLPLHRDRIGKWVVQFNIERSKAVKGGEILIGSRRGQIIKEQLLSEPLDGYVVDNDILTHGARGLSIEPGSVRDVLILQFS